MILHIANKNYSSWSLRPWVLLRALDVPFEERVHPFGDDFRAFSPSARVPCLHDGDLVVWDSLAIVEHVAETWPAVWPADRAARAWARSAAAGMHSSFGALREQCSMSCGIRVALHRVARRAPRRAGAVLGHGHGGSPPRVASRRSEPMRTRTSARAHPCPTERPDRCLRAAADRSPTRQKAGNPATPAR